ncbi:hypothetical protein OTERR_10610 [Oryzomicrobium terrae]|uniref:Uncharacterized protein n=1 Tax=Oryzomicrobium terrae TaxID=1735038 RepID=A0A5C1E8K0_9RHOO|nr:hypothetical protein [Oryzomicrobium terrae]QEL64537.1 hypothetical protein OTERR_10610 [Oryzomicrobium terrae]
MFSLHTLLRPLRSALTRASLRLASKLIVSLLRRLTPVVTTPHGAEPAMARARRGTPTGNAASGAPRSRVIDGDARRIDDPRSHW